MTEQISLFDGPNPGEYPFTEQAQRARCASCGKSVVWIRTEAGKAMPLSLVTERQINGVAYATTHFADCPQGRAWRKDGK